jgi:hypothetical protein
MEPMVMGEGIADPASIHESRGMSVLQRGIRSVARAPAG